MIFVSSQKALSPEIKTVIKQQLENASNGWTAYRIARQASRMVGENKYLEEDVSVLLEGSYLNWKKSVRKENNRAQSIENMWVAAGNISFSFLILWN